MNVEVPHLRDWFAPFNDGRVPHPYTETPPSIGPELHDLRRRLRGTGQTSDHLLDTAIVESAEPLSSLEPGSEVVALARQASDRDVPDLWIADHSNPEASFAALVTIAGRAEGGSGWLTWEPHEGADTVRTDPVVYFVPHRHFPSGSDEPWADVALSGGRLIAVPLKHVVSYRPDSEVRRRWNNLFNTSAT